MATTSTVYNPVTGRTRTITAEVEYYLVQSELDAVPEFYIKMVTNAVNSVGTRVGPAYVDSLSTLPDDGGTKQHPNGSTDPYTDLTASMQNWNRHLIEGDGDGGMDF